MFTFCKTINKKENQDDADEIEKDIEDGGITGRDGRLMNLIGDGNYQGDQSSNKKPG